MSTITMGEFFMLLWVVTELQLLAVVIWVIWRNPLIERNEQ